jgi:MFS family permease
MPEDNKDRTAAPTDTKQRAPDQLPVRTKLLFSTGDLSTSIPLAILMFFQLYFLTDVAALPPALAGWAVGIGRIWDAVNDPLFGLVSDRIRTRWGRRRVLLLFGAVPLGVSFALMWIVPPWGPLALTAYYAIVFILFDTVFTAVHVGYNALTPEMTPDYDERSSLNGYRMVFSIAGTLGAIILATILGWYIDDLRFLYSVVGIALGLASIAPPLIVFAVTRERPSDELPEPMPVLDALKATLTNHPFWLVMGLYLLSWTTASILAAVLIYFANYYLRVPGQANYHPPACLAGPPARQTPGLYPGHRCLDRRAAGSFWPAAAPGDAGLRTGRLGRCGHRHCLCDSLVDGARHHRIRPGGNRRAARGLLLCLCLLFPENGHRRGHLDHGPGARLHRLHHTPARHAAAGAAARGTDGHPHLYGPGAHPIAGAGHPLCLALPHHARAAPGTAR